MNEGLIQPLDAAPRAPLPGIRVEEPLLLTIFGATGDLTLRKLIPGLYAMFRQGLLPDRFAVVGFARRDYDDERFRTWMAKAVRAHSRLPVDEESVAAFCGHLYYHRGDLGDPEGYALFRQRFMESGDFPRKRLFYLSIKPDLFETVVRHLKQADLITPLHAEDWTRVVVEKPFGHDLASASALNQQLSRHLREPQIFRIDHYLGKETVQNILSFRFANAIFEPLFTSHHVDHIQITAGETVGMESGRGAYYDSVGAVRDMVQNHLFQLMCLVLMEPPSGLNAAAIHNEKVKVLHALVPPGPEGALRAQYTAGSVGGQAVPGYLEEDRIDPASRTETFAALRFELHNWRWAGVPVYLRTGKRMARRQTEIAVQFKSAPLDLFQTVECRGDVCDLTHTRPNTLVFRIQPEEGISLTFSAKRPGLQVQVESMNMDFSYSEAWEQDLPEAYERLLLDVMRGDSTLFTRSDEVETAWAMIDPILGHWAADTAPLPTYPAGSWGPPEADRLFGAGPHCGWRKG